MIDKVAFVTGATGFVGQHVVFALQRRGYRIRALIRNSEKFNDLFSDLNGVEAIVGKLDDPAAIEECLDGVSYVYHIAGVTKTNNVSDYFQTNVILTKRLYEIIGGAKKHLERVIHVSTLAAIGPSMSKCMVDTNQNPNPISSYGISKIKGEMEAWELSKTTPVTIIRPPAVFGPGDKDILVFFKIISKGIIPLIGYEDKLVSLIYVEDLAEGMIDAAESPNTIGKAYYLCYENPMNWSDFGKLVATILGKRCKIVRIPHWILKSVAFFSEYYGKVTQQPQKLNLETAKEIVQPYWLCSPQEAKIDFGFEARTLINVSVQKTIDWYKHNGLINDN